MGAADVGRELGDAGGPLFVGAVAAAFTLGWGLTALALILALIARAGRSDSRASPNPERDLMTGRTASGSDYPVVSTGWKGSQGMYLNRVRMNLKSYSYRTFGPRQRK
jgi:hypothetical protein